MGFEDRHVAAGRMASRPASSVAGELCVRKVLTLSSSRFVAGALEVSGQATGSISINDYRELETRYA